MKKTPVPKWMHRLLGWGIVMFVFLCLTSLYARNWIVAAGMAAMAVAQWGAWSTSQPREQ